MLLLLRVLGLVLAVWSAQKLALEDLGSVHCGDGHACVLQYSWALDPGSFAWHSRPPPLVYAHVFGSAVAGVPSIWRDARVRSLTAALPYRSVPAAAAAVVLMVPGGSAGPDSYVAWPDTRSVVGGLAVGTASAYKAEEDVSPKSTSSYAGCPGCLWPAWAPPDAYMGFAASLTTSVRPGG